MSRYVPPSSARSSVSTYSNDTPRSTISDRGKITGRKHVIPASATNRGKVPRGQDEVRSPTAADPDKITIVALLNMADYTSNTQTVVPFDIPLFEPTPRRIEFAQYQPFQTYTATITLRNKDNYSRRVKITPPESPYFVLSAPQFAGRSANLPASIVSSTTDGKVAPHATVQYTLTFKPQARADYSIDLVVVTEREKFLLPIRVFGDRAKLTFPGEIAFPKCPVKYPMQRPLLIGNTGTRGSRFHFLATAPFFVDPPDGYVGVDENVQVSVVFCPSAEGDFEGDLVITDDDNQTSLCRVFGSAECADVYLEVSELNCPPAYLDLVSQTSLKIVNKSLVPVRFDWKMFSSSEEDEHHRAMLCAELDDQEDAERRALEEHGYAASDDERVSDDSDEEREFVAIKAAQAISRKYKRLRAEINDGPLRFSDPNFSIEPAFGEIWPGGSVEVDVRFRPNIATMYGATAFCEVTGRVTRLPVLFKGNGIGPKAMFSYDTLDIGEVLIGGIYHYTVKIQNVGDIDAEYALLPSQGTSKSRFSFTPSSGVLVAEQVQEIAISFTCATLGPFSEVSEWSLPGRTEPMTITFRGQVVAPRFRFDRNELDFGQVSFGFLQSVTLSLSNESDIPFQFALSISDDGKYYGKEFGLTPSSGLIMPYEAQSIRVDFIAGSIKKYNNFLHVDAEGIGAALLRLPIKAECLVPTLSLSAEKLDFEKCFLRYGYTKTVELVNTSNLPAKFEVVFPEDINPMADSLTCDQAAGSIAPNSSVQLGIKMIARHLGPVSLALYVRTVGSEVPPKVIQATADGIGPILRLENSGLDFGLMPVLNAKTSVLKVHNDSPIPAAFKAFVTKKGSVFAVHPPVGRMEPNSSVDLRVIAYLDDNPKQTDVIHVVAEEGADYTATVAARGDGTTIKAETPIDQLRLGPVFTGQSLKKTFRLENQGRRAQTLSFEFVRRLVSDKSGKSTASKPGTRPATGADVPAAAASAVEKKDAAKAPKEAKTIFTITPDKITLQPFTAMIFTVEGTTNEAGITAEQWAIKSLVAGDKSPSVIMNPEFHGEFLTPLLESSAPKGLNFLYSFVPGVPIMPQMQQLTLTNVGALPLVFMFKCPVPFSVDRLECELASGESTTITVQFDPGLNTTRVSEYIRQALVIVYRDHNQKDRIPLNGDICFPNLTLEKTAVDFGCVLNETQKRVTMVMTNHSRVAARYQWSFVEEVEVDGAPLIVPSSAPVAVVPNSSRSRRPPSASSTRAGSAASMRDTPTPTGGMSSSVLALQQQQNEKALAAAAAAAAQTYAVNEVFDVLPIRGFLQPGESEEVQFVFFGHPEVNMKTLAVCEVVGGPDYEVALHGEASSIIYRLDREKIEFGDQEFSQQRVQELVLQNLSRMPFNFTVNLSSFKYAHTVTVSPPMGLVKALEKQKILVTFFPGLPLEIIETFHVQVEYFDPIPIQVTGRGVFSQLLSSLPRVEQSDFQRHLAMASSQARFAQPLLPVLPVEPIPAARAPTASGTASGARPAGSPMAAKSNAQTAAPLTPRVNQTSAAELEAERLLFVEFLQKQKTSFLAPTAAMNPSALLKAQSGDGAARLSSPAPSLVSLSLVKEDKSVPGGAIIMPSFLLSTFECDLGHIIRGTSKSRRFKLSNVGASPMSFDVNAKALQRTAFTIAPMKVSRLAPGDSVEITVSYAAAVDAEMQPIKLDIPIEVKDAPPYSLQVKCNVTSPMLDVSRTMIDMGPVPMGFVCESLVHFTCVSPIPCEWSAGKLACRSAEEAELFVITPQSGVVQPGQTVTLSVVFRPTKVSAEAIIGKLPVKITSNPKSISLTYRALPSEAGFRLQPSSVILGPIVPTLASAPAPLVLCNDTDTAIEVHSLDFDSKYLQEDDVLRGLTAWDERGELLVQPRRAGQPLPPAVLAHAQRQQDESLLAQLLQAQQPSSAFMPTHPAVSVDSPPVALAVPTALPQKAVLVWVVGPPLSGASTTSTALARKMGVPLLTLSQMLSFFVSDPAGEVADKELVDRLKAADWASREKAPELVSACILGYLNAHQTLSLTGAVVDGLDFHTAAHAASVAAGVVQAMSSLDSKRMSPLAWHIFQLDVAAEVSATRLEAAAAVVAIELAALDARIDRSWSTGVLKAFKPLAADELARMSEEERVAYADLASKQHLLNTETSLKERQVRYLPDAVASKHAQYVEACAVLRDVFAKDAVSVNTPSLATTVAMTPSTTVTASFEPNQTTGTEAEGAPALDVTTSEPETLPVPVAPVETVVIKSRPVTSAAAAPQLPAKFWWRHSMIDAHPALETVASSATTLFDKGHAASDHAASGSASPDDILRQILTKPGQRPARAPITNFQLVNWVEPVVAVAADAPVEGAAAPAAEAAAPAAPTEASTRWVIAPRSTITVGVRYLSDVVGQHDASFGFELFGRAKQYALPLKGTCAYPEISSDSRTVFMHRIKTKKPNTIVKKQFIADQNVFDFGPLMVGRDAGQASRHDRATMKVFAETFRITNTGLFATRVDFSLRGQMSERPPTAPATGTTPRPGTGEDKKKPAAPAAAPAAAEPAATPAFVFEPEFIELGLDEVKDVTVWAFPSTIGVVEDALVCTVRQNPTPVSFPLRCEGARPACELSAAALNFERMLIAQTDKKTVTLTNTSPLPVVWGLSYAPQAGDAPILNPAPPPSAGGAKPPSAPASTEGAAPATINPIVGGSGQTVLSMDELRIEPASGVLKPLSSVEVAINYVALQQRIIDRKLKLEIKDNEGVLGVVDTKQLQIQAEAFEIDYKLDLPPGGLDFGSVRVAEDERREFTLKNQGKYEIKYNFSSAPAQPAGGKKRVRSDVLSELITVSPASGELKPQEEIKVVMTFRSSREVTLKANSDMKMTVVEAQTQSSVPVVPIRITANAVFSKYRILPMSGINFGPMEIDTIKQKKLEIYNDGEFDFEYKLLAAPKVLPKSRSGTESERPGTSSGKPSTPADAAKPAAAPPSARGAKPDPKAAAAPAASAQQLTVGAFSLTPATGTVPKGGKVVIDISLNANAVEVFQENIELDISNRDPVRDAHIYYELQGEGCAPCIETEDLESIFEEQSVERHVENRLNGKNVFSAEDRIFFFAPVIAAASGTADTAPSVERFKIINPGKVPCNVTFDIKPRDAKSAEEVNAFKLEPAALHIPSHEYRFVSVSFAPKDMAQFSARFTATVEKGSGKTGSMTYELRGQGTLPRVTMERPMVRDESGCPLLQFGRLFMGRSKTMMVVLRNDGVIPSTCRLEVPGAVFGPAAATSGNSFRYMGRSVVTIAPQQTARLPITYRPAAVGSHNGELRLSVSQNPFEDSIIKFVGEAYQEDVTLEGLEGHAEGVGATMDEEDKEGKEEEKDQQAIDFGDVSVGTTKSRTFTLVNHSAFAYRFAWPSGGSSLRYEPSTGHLAPRSNKTITVHFAPSAAQSMSAETQGVVLERIALEEPDAEGGIWDDRQQELMYLTDKQFEAFQAANEKRNEILKQNSNAASSAIAEAAKATAAFLADPKNKGKTPPAAPAAPQAEVPPPVAVPERDPTDEGDLNAHMIAKPEPKYKAVPLPDGATPHAPVALRVSGVSDLTRYQLNVPSASFRPTMMFQSRVFKFPMRNLSQTQLEYKWRLQMITPTQRELDGTAPLIPVESTFPFIVAPASGKIAPNQEEEFTVKFAPWDAVDYECELIADVVALDPALSAPRLVLSGTGQRPKCHLELAPCDYLSSNRRAADMRNPDGSVGALDATQFRVVELNSLGTRVRNTKRFFVLNPTNMSYAYEWSCQDTAATSTGASPFRLATTKGLVLAGKRAEMVLEYTPEEVGLSESFWTFTIPEHDIRVQFLFVGSVAEPELALERTHINFNALVVGATQRETAYLVNREHLPFAFTVDPSSYQADGALSVEPTSGVVPPDGRFPVQLRFAPREEKAYNLNVQFRVKNKPGRVVLNVKGEGYAIRDVVQIEEADGRVTELSSTQLSRLDFGTVQLPERAVKRVAIINSGKFNFDFQWTYARSKMLEIVPESGTVKRGGKVLCDVTFVAGQEEVLDRLRAVCAIAGGARQYVTLISGTARRPLLDISSTDVDFGPTFVGARPSVHTLRVTNREPQRNVTVEMVFESRPYLEVRGAAAVLAPGESTEFQLVFTPRDLQAYSETVRLDFNGGYSVNVPVRGEGTALRLELASPAQQNVQFGNLRLGSTATRAVRLVNSSRRTVRMSLKLGGALSVSGGADVSEESASAAPVTENSLGISFAPHPSAASLLELRPNQSVEMNIRFAPRSRLAAFVEDVSFECEGMVRSLLRLSGACHGVGLAFESDNVPFGSAVLHSSVARRLQLENVGDVGCRFRFDAQRFAPDFSVTPTEGFVAPHDSLTLDLTFHPTKIQPDIRYNRIPCQVDGAPTLYLTLTGACLPSPDEAAKELRFETKVRRPVTRQVVIENPTSVKWSLNPALSHEAWTGPNALEVPAGGKAEYEVTYKPLRTTQSGGEPESTELFFPLPNGQATVYRLIGTASAPDAEDSIEVEAPCKKLFVKSLPVRNWLPRAQRFKVLIETESKDPSVSIKGAASIEVPGLLERELKLSFYAYKEGVTKSTVRFVNETTNEYLFYNVTFTSTKAGVLANLAMDAPVRQRVSSLVSIRNPLADAAEIARFECDSPDVHVALPLRIDPDSERSIEVWYRPLARVKKQTASLALFSPELGDFRYTLELSSSTVPNERTLRFDTSLGGESAQTFRFASFEQGATEFECKVSGSEFVVEQAKIKATGAARGSDGEQLSVELRYEPTNLGDVRDVLTITALNGKGSAEYRVPLYGHCDPPKPLGPIVIKSGANASIAFKNVFANAEEFSFSVDNPNFTVAKPKEKIDAKKSTQLSVSFKAPAGAVAGTQALMAKLTVTCPNMPPWLYYLRGSV